METTPLRLVSDADTRAGDRGPFRLVIRGRQLIAVPDDLGANGWRWFEERHNGALGSTEAVEVAPPSYSAVMDALTGRA